MIKKLACRIASPTMKNLSAAVGVDYRLGVHAVTAFMEQNNMTDESQVSPEAFTTWWKAATSEEKSAIDLQIPNFEKSPSSISNVITTDHHQGRLRLVYPAEVSKQMEALEYLRGHEISSTRFPEALKEIETLRDAATFLLYKAEFNASYPEGSIKLPKGVSYNDQITLWALNKLKEAHKQEGYLGREVPYDTAKSLSNGELSGLDSNGNAIIKESVSVKEFIEHIQGAGTPSAVNTKNGLVMKEMEKFGVTVNSLTALIKNPAQVRRFLALREYYNMQHPENRQVAASASPNDPINIRIAANANLYAYRVMSGQSITPKAEYKQIAQQATTQGEKTITYEPKGKARQTYTIRGNKIFNKEGKEVFKEDSVDRNKIFANLAVREGRAVVVEHKGAQYVVNNKNAIISVTSGKVMQWGEENGDRKAILEMAKESFAKKAESQNSTPSANGAQQVSATTQVSPTNEVVSSPEQSPQVLPEGATEKSKESGETAQAEEGSLNSGPEVMGESNALQELATQPQSAATAEEQSADDINKTVTPIKEVTVTQEIPESGSVPANVVRSNINISANEQSPIFKVLRQLNSVQQEARINYIARALSQNITSALNSRIKRLEKEVAETHDLGKLKELMQLQDPETGRKNGIIAVLKEALDKTRKDIEEIADEMEGMSAEEIADDWGITVAVAEYRQQQYRFFADNFDVLFTLASPVIEQLEDVRIDFDSEGSPTVQKAEDKVEEAIATGEEDAQGDEEGDEGATGNEGYSYEARMVDPHKTIRSITRKILGSLKRYNREEVAEDGVTKSLIDEVDDLGNPTYMREDVVHTILLNEFSKLVKQDTDFMVRTGHGETATYEYPALKELAKTYLWARDILRQVEEDPQKGTALFVDLYKPFQEYWSQKTVTETKEVTKEDGSPETVTSTTTKSFRVNDLPADQTVLDKVQQSYVEGHQAVRGDKMLWNSSSAIVPENADQILADITEIQDGLDESYIEPKNAIKDLTYALNRIGVDITADRLAVLTAVDNAETTINKLINSINTIVKTAKTLPKDTNLITECENAYRAISSIVGQVDDLHNQLMFRQGKADMPSFCPPNYIDYLKAGFAREDARKFMEEEFGYDGFLFDKAIGEFRNPILQQLYTDPEVRKKIRTKYIKMMQGVSPAPGKAGPVTEYRDWTKSDIMENYVFEYFSELGDKDDKNLYGNYTLPIPSDSEMGIFIRLPRLTSDTRSTAAEKVNKAFVNVVKQELYRIKKIRKRAQVGAAQIQRYDTGGAKFFFFPQLNDLIVEGKSFADHIESLPENERDQAILDVITAVNKERFEKFYKRNSNIRLGHVNTALDEESHRAYLEEFFYNNSLAQVAIIQMTTTDLAYYKNYTDFQKRFKQVFASGSRLNTQSKFGRETERSLYFADKIQTSSTYDGIQTNLEQSVKDGKMTEPEASVIMQKLRSINQDDAQALRSMSSLRAVLDMAGKWDARMEDAFQRIKKGEMTYADFDLMWGALKPFIFANLPVNDGLGEQMRVPTQHKDSEALLMGFVGALRMGNKTAESPILMGLNRAMEDFQIDKAIFESGVKEGGQCVIDISYSREKMDSFKYKKETIKDEKGNEVRQESDEWKSILRDARALIIEEKTKEGRKPSEKDVEKAFNSKNDYYKYKAALDYRLIHKKDGFTQEDYNKAIVDMLPSEQEVYDIIDQALHYNAFENYKNIHRDAFAQGNITDGQSLIDWLDSVVDAEKLTDRDRNIAQALVGKDTISKDDYAQIVKEAKPSEVFEEFIDENGKSYVENSNVVHKIPYRYYMEAQPTTNHLVDTDTVFGSQFRNLITSDMDPSMVITVGGKVLRACNAEGKNEIIEFYQQLITENLIQGFKELQQQFGTIENLQKRLLQMIQTNPSYGLEMRDALQIVTDEQGNKVFNMPFHNPTICVKMEQLVMSMFKNTIAKQKIRGASCVLVTDFGYDTQLKVLRGADGGIIGFQCMMPAHSKHLFEPFLEDVVDPKSGALIGQRVNMEKLRAADPEGDLLKGCGFRIPTENKYSMANMVITGFLPSQMGSVVMMPAECTQLAGWDFDVDKLFIMLKSFTTGKNGMPKVVGYDANIPVKDWYPKDNVLAEKARNNALVDIARAILAHPTTAEKINNPGNYDTLSRESDRSLVQRDFLLEWGVHKGYLTEDMLADLKAVESNTGVVLQNALESAEDPSEAFVNNALDPEAREDIIKSIQNASADELRSFLENYENSVDPLDLETFAYYHNQNMVGGKLISIYANNTTAQAKYQQSHLKVGKEYRFTINGYNVADLSGTTRVNSDGTKVLISKNCAEFSAASVDNVKDPKLANMMQSPDNAFITGTMLRMGLTMGEISNFFSVFASAGLDMPTSTYALNKLLPVYGYDKKSGGLAREHSILQEGKFSSMDIARTVQMMPKVMSLIDVYGPGHLTQALGEAVRLGLMSQQDVDSFHATMQVLFKILKVAPEVRTLTSISRADSPNGAVSHTLAGAINQVMRVMGFHAKQRAFHILEGTEDLIKANAFKTGTVTNLQDEEMDYGQVSQTIDQIRETLFSDKFCMPMLEGFFALGIQGAIQTSSSYFKQLSPAMIAGINRLRLYCGSDYLTDKVIDSFLKDAVTFFLTRSSMFKDTLESDRARFRLQYPSHFTKIKSDPALSQYSVIKRIKNDKGKLIIGELPRLKGVKEQFARELVTMLFDDGVLKNGEAVSKVALDLFKYSFFEDGLGWRVGGFSTLFTPTFLAALPEYMRDMRNMDFESESDINLFFNQFIRKRKNATTLFKNFKASDVSSRVDGIELSTGKAHNYKMGVPHRYITVTNETGDPRNPITRLYAYDRTEERQSRNGKYTMAIYKEVSMTEGNSPMYNANSNTDDIKKGFEEAVGAINKSKSGGVISQAQYEEAQKRGTQKSYSFMQPTESTAPNATPTTTSDTDAINGDEAKAQQQLEDDEAGMTRAEMLANGLIDDADMTIEELTGFSDGQSLQEFAKEVTQGDDEDVDSREALAAYNEAEAKRMAQDGLNSQQIKKC